MEYNKKFQVIVNGIFDCTVDIDCAGRQGLASLYEGEQFIANLPYFIIDDVTREQLETAAILNLVRDVYGQIDKKDIRIINIEEKMALLKEIKEKTANKKYNEIEALEEDMKVLYNEMSKLHEQLRNMGR